MKAAVFPSAHTAPGAFIHVENIPRPQLKAGHILLRVVACGVCRTDLHIVEEDLPPIRPQLIPDVLRGSSYAGIFWVSYRTILN